MCRSGDIVLNGLVGTVRAIGSGSGDTKITGVNMAVTASTSGSGDIAISPAPGKPGCLRHSS